MPYVGRDAASFTTVVDVTVSDDLTVTDDATIGGALSAKGGAVFNDDSVDVDFRVESNGNANMLFVDGGNDAVGIGTSTFDSNTKLQVFESSGNVHIGMRGADNASVSAAFVNASGNAVYNGMFGDQTGGAGNWGVYNGGLRLIVDTAGDIDVKTGDIYFSTAGKGIVLGATSNTAANTLSDYEEGTHQTAISMSTSGTATLNTSFDRFSYTKIGRLVTITGNPRIASVSSPVGAMTMTLPFTANAQSTDEARAGGVFRYYDNSAGSGSYSKPMSWQIVENTSTLSIDNVHSSGAVLAPAASDEFIFNFSYITAS
jgi:prepilin-type processing-associated H-X9-DG protein